jgi:hypothetical protein
VSVRRITVAGIGDSGGLRLSGALSVSVTVRSVSIAAIRATISAAVSSVSCHKNLIIRNSCENDKTSFQNGK